MPPSENIPRISRVAILGLGPSGLATLARFLKFHPTHFSTIDLFEQRDDVGGIWNYTREARPLVEDSLGTNTTTNSDSAGVEGKENHQQEQEQEPRVLLPLDDSRHEHAREADRPIRSPEPRGGLGWVGDGDGDGHGHGHGVNGVNGVWNKKGEYIYPSSLYPSLRANLPTPLMAFPDYPFPSSMDLFPGHIEILSYLREFFRRLNVREVRPGAHTPHTVGEGRGVTAWFGKVVRRMEKLENGNGWRVVVGNIGEEEGEGEGEESFYDAVVIAGGRYSVPYIPDIPGLKKWVIAGKGRRRVEHSREFREVEGRYRGRKILLIGSSVSAADILRLLLPLHPSLPIYQSTRKPPTLSQPQTTQTTPTILSISTISHFDPLTGTIHLHPSPSNPSLPTTLHDIDTLLFCTGYILTAPFLPPTHPNNPSQRGTYIPDLLLHCISKHDPTLAWIGLPYRVAPFPVTAGQAGVLARLWSGYLSLGEIEEGNRDMEEENAPDGGRVREGKEWERVRRDVSGGGREPGAFTHFLAPPRDHLFMDRLAKLCQDADVRDERDEKSGDGKGQEQGQEVKRGKEWYGDYAVWSEYLKKVRMRLSEVRERYDTAAREGRRVCTFEEIGFGWKEVMGVGNGGESGNGPVI